MDIPTSCTHCDCQLLVDEKLVGQSALCENCQQAFVVIAAPNRTVPTDSPDLRVPKAASNKSRSRRYDTTNSEDAFETEYEFDDNRPIRRKPKHRPSTLAPLIFGGSMLIMIGLVAVGLFFAFGFSLDPQPITPNDHTVFRLANARWEPNQGLRVDVEVVARSLPAGRFRLAWQSIDQLHQGSMSLAILRPRFSQSLFIHHVQGQTIQIWIEDDPPLNGVKHSNVLTFR